MKCTPYKMKGDYFAVNSAIDSYIAVYSKIARVKASNMLLDNGIPPNPGEEDMLLNDVKEYTDAAHDELASLRAKENDVEHEGMRRTVKQLAEDAEKFLMGYFDFYEQLKSYKT